MNDSEKPEPNVGGGGPRVRPELDDLLERARLRAEDIRNQRERLYAACISSDGWVPMIDELAAQLADLRGERDQLQQRLQWIDEENAELKAWKALALKAEAELAALRGASAALQQQIDDLTEQVRLAAEAREDARAE